MCPGARSSGRRLSLLSSQMLVVQSRAVQPSLSGRDTGGQLPAGVVTDGIKGYLGNYRLNPYIEESQKRVITTATITITSNHYYPLLDIYIVATILGN